jgi:pimeloyl-ACP methyl ester carboxylesterase
MRNTYANAGWEYTFVGSGEPILVLHGGHSNCQEDFGYDELLRVGYSILTPSRPGYGATRAETGRIARAAAQSLINLSDHLNLQQVHVLGISGGGPTALTFAALFHERVTCLILESAVSKRWLTPQDATYKRAKRVFAPSRERFVWGFIKRFAAIAPKLVAEGMLAQLSKRPFSSYRHDVSQEDLEQVREMILKSSSGQGFMLDLEHASLYSLSNAHFAQRRRWTSAVFTRGLPTEKIRNATLLSVPGWGHLIWLGKSGDVVDKAVTTFLSTYR